MSRSVDPLRLLIILALSAAVGTKVLLSVYGEESSRARTPSGTASLSGTVTDPDGAPRAHVSVRIAGDDRGWATQSGSDGRYTFANLPAGDFYVSASHKGFLEAYYGEAAYNVGMKSVRVEPGAAVEDIDIRLDRAGSISGVVYDDTGTPAARRFLRIRREDGTTPRLPGLATTDDRGRYRIGGLPPGQYVLLANFQTDGTSRTYYPNAATIAEATRIELGPGQDLTGVDILGRKRTTTVVAGRIVNSTTGQAAKAVVRLSTDDVDLKINATSTGPDGRFQFDAVPPGEYRVVAYAAPPADDRAGTAPPESWGLVEIVSDGRRPVDVTVAVEAGVPLTGRVTFAGVDDARVPDRSKIMLAITAADRPTRDLLSTVSERIEVLADHSFRAAGVPRGSYRIWAAISGSDWPPPDPTSWSLGSVVDRTERPLDTTFDVAPGRAPEDIVLTIVNRPSELTGTLVDPSGRPMADRAIFVLPADPALWPAGDPETTASIARGLFGPSPYRFQRAVTNSQGRFTVRGLLVGEYVVAAIDGLPRDVRLTRPLLKELARGATRVSLTAGGRVETVLRNISKH